MVCPYSSEFSGRDFIFLMRLWKDNRTLYFQVSGERWCLAGASWPFVRQYQSCASRRTHFFFAYQICKPQFHSVVQFPYDNRHSPFSLTTVWFQQQEEFNSTIEKMTRQQLNKCLHKFHLSARGRDETFYNKRLLTAIRAALDRHIKKKHLKQLFTLVSVNSGRYLPRRFAAR